MGQKQKKCITRHSIVDFFLFLKKEEKKEKDSQLSNSVTL